MGATETHHVGTRLSKRRESASARGPATVYTVLIKPYSTVYTYCTRLVLRCSCVECVGRCHMPPPRVTRLTWAGGRSTERLQPRHLLVPVPELPEQPRQRRPATTRRRGPVACLGPAQLPQHRLGPADQDVARVAAGSVCGGLRQEISSLLICCSTRNA